MKKSNNNNLSQRLKINKKLTNLRLTVRALISPVLSNSAKFYGYLNLLKDTQKGKELKERFEVTARNRTRPLEQKAQLC